MYNKMLTAALVIVACLQLTACITVAPVHATYEKAATLGKGNVELNGHYTHYIVSSGGESEAINNNIGVRAGYGLSDKVDLKVRYEKLMVVDQEPGSDFKANYFALIPKFNFKPGKLSLFVPLSTYTFKNSDGDHTSSSRSYSIATHLVQTFTAKSNKVDFSAMSNLEYIFPPDDDETNGDFLMGVNLGAGFSTDLNKWTIRPEMGVLFKPGETGMIFNFGVGLQFMLPTGKKAK